MNGAGEKNAAGNPLGFFSTDESLHTCILAAKRVPHLLHEHSVVTLKGDIHVHVCLHGPNLVGSQEPLSATALPAALQDLCFVPGGSSLEPAGQHVHGLGIPGVALCSNGLQNR